MENRMCY